jgi:hypothetical protein
VASFRTYQENRNYMELWLYKVTNKPAQLNSTPWRLKLQAFLTSILNGDTHHACFTHGNKTPATHWLGGLVGPKVDLDTMTLPRTEHLSSYPKPGHYPVWDTVSHHGLGTTASRPALGPIQPPSQWVPGALSLGVKQPGREADHSPPSSAEVKNWWSYTSTPQYVFMAWFLVKHRENFSFTFDKHLQAVGELKVHVKLSLCFLTEHHALKAYWGVEV